MYYVLERFWARHPARWIDEYPRIDGDPGWTLGRRHAVTVPRPLQFVLDPLNPLMSDMGPDMPEYFKGAIPLFRDDLLAALREAGVDNLDVYDAVILDPDSGEAHHNYRAVNIIGTVTAVDWANSSTTIHPGGPVIDVDLDGFSIDEERAGGLLMFRLAENVGGIMVHESVADHLLTRGFDALEFLHPQDVAL